MLFLQYKCYFLKYKLNSFGVQEKKFVRAVQNFAASLPPFGVSFAVLWPILAGVLPSFG
jgi:hypothetical protein